jgi:hypothetical protein
MLLLAEEREVDLLRDQAHHKVEHTEEAEEELLRDTGMQ